MAVSAERIRPPSAVEIGPPHEAVQNDEADLFPISPELALVDPELAEQARRRLPDRPWRTTTRPRPAPPPSLSPPFHDRPDMATAPAPPLPVSRRPRRRIVLLAGLTLALGVAAGALLAEWRADSPQPTLEARTATPRASTRADVSKRLPKERATPVRRARSGSSKRVSGRSRRRPTAALPPHRLGTRRRWAANVLGVTASVGRSAVKLVWQKPASSGHVVVLRTLGAQKRGIVVYRGRASSYRDASPRPCTAYRYTIVNYDKHGHRSTGVPTSVVTGNCG